MQIPKVDWSKMEWKKIRDGVYQKAFKGFSATAKTGDWKGKKC